MPIIKEPNKILRKKAGEITLGDIQKSKIKKLIADMKETLKNTLDGVGLAAPQIGESLRLFIVSEEAEEIDRTDWKRERGLEKPYEKREWKYYVFINPKVKKTAKRKIADGEGCLSVPGKYGIVKRHEKITVEAHDETGKKFTRGASKFFARVLQHELDHLDGTLFIDKADKIIDSASVIK